MKNTIYHLITFLIFFFIGYNIAPFPPMVSVVIPTYNRAHLLPRAIESVLTQTMQDFELVIVDDASTDNTQELLKQYKKKSNKIKVITHTTNQGVSAARNTGNKNALGKYIIILDSDDYALPNMLEDSVRFMENNPSLVIGIPAKMGFKTNRTDQLMPWHYPAYDFLQGNHLGNVGNIFKRDFIQKHNISYKKEYICAEDYDFWIQIILNGGGVGKIEDEKHLPIFTTAFRIHSENNYKDFCYKNSKKIWNNIFSFLNLPPNQNTPCHQMKKLLEIYPHLLLSHEKERAISALCSPSKK